MVGATIIGSSSSVAEGAKMVNSEYCKDCNVGQRDGVFYYNYDIAVPEGRNGMTPAVSLGYSQFVCVQCCLNRCNLPKQGIAENF